MIIFWFYEKQVNIIHNLENNIKESILILILKFCGWILLVFEFLLTLIKGQPSVRTIPYFIYGYRPDAEIGLVIKLKRRRTTGFIVPSSSNLPQRLLFLATGNRPLHHHHRHRRSIHDVMTAQFNAASEGLHQERSYPQATLASTSATTSSPTPRPKPSTQKLQSALGQDPLTALKLFCHLRAVRGAGKAY